jgi:hypothetical protein
VDIDDGDGCFDMGRRVGPDELLLQSIAYAGDEAFGAVEIGDRVVANR